MRAKSPVKPALSLHPRNRHLGRYDFDALVAAYPALAQFVAKNPRDELTIDFTNPTAVKALNRALLLQVYGVRNWDIPPGYLCPPIPGRADYIHNLADLLAGSNHGKIPRGKGVRVMDIGMGANCVYPLIGNAEYGWSFVGTDIDPAAIKNAQAILNANRLMAGAIELRRQKDPKAIFSQMIHAEERFDLTLCNPPFHPSQSVASQGTERKWQNLNKQTGSMALNFGGHASELCCQGGEEAFVRRMIAESRAYADRCFWFSSLVSKAASLPSVYRALQHNNVAARVTIDMAQGQKQSRLVAWTFLTPEQQSAWR